MLKESFPHLQLFSDLNWDAVAREYEPTSAYVTFPEYLELKAEEGDCSPHLFELAYFDAALGNIESGEFFFPDTPGIYLNPSACFLSFDHDILEMVKKAHDGEITVIERPNVLCIYLDDEGQIRFHQLTTSELELLQSLEGGNILRDHKDLSALSSAGLILAIS